MTKLQELLSTCWMLAEAIRLKDHKRHDFATEIADKVLRFDNDTPQQFSRTIINDHNKGN